MTRALALLVLGVVALPGGGPSKVITVDICVYGGTSAGVLAAVAAARQGRSVVIVEPSALLGGMSSSGIGLVDRGDVATIGGLALEFYRQAGKMYGKDIAWRLEPSVAQRVFERLAASEGNLRVLRETRLIEADVTGKRIRSLSVSSGIRVNAEVFIDASYEGDLMALAGVTYTVGRESGSVYKESLAGIRPNTSKHQFEAFVDPYSRKGDRSSGLLPGVSAEPLGLAGQGDGSLPAYTYRLCVTKRPNNKIEIKKPDHYNPLRYELLARYVAAQKSAGLTVTLRDLVQLDSLPNGKFDLNNRGPASIDFIGGSRHYAEGSFSERRQIEEQHENYIRGLFTFLRSDPRLPQRLRWEAKQFGLAADEFQANGGWPPLLYVREARRMVGEYVVTQADCEGKAEQDSSIGLASYMIDSHNCRTLAVQGRARNEGDMQMRTPGPYSVPYAAVVPNRSECENLLVPVCLSASHVAYSSIRMEPVFMILGESVGIAAAITAESGGAVHDIEPSKLKFVLLKAGQILRPRTQ